MDVTLSLETIKAKIFLIRGHKVLIDSDLAEMYGVETKNFKQVGKEKPQQFPDDFMFQLTTEESVSLRFQSGTSTGGHGGRRYNPYVFTEQGVAMLSSIFNGDQAVSSQRWQRIGMTGLFNQG